MLSWLRDVLKHMHTALSSISKRVEVRMSINSLILVLIMTIKTVSYAQLAFRFDIFGISGNLMQYVSADIFSMINPLLLLAVSATVRSMLAQFVRGRKFHV